MNGQRCLLCDEPAELDICNICLKAICDGELWDSEGEDLDECFASKRQAKLTEGFQIMKGAD